MAKDKKPLPNGGEVVKEEVHEWPPLDGEGKFKWINKDELNIDHEYQRLNVSNDRVLAIAREFSWRACGVLLVMRRPDGTLWVYDGQHRLNAALKRTSIAKMPCLIFDVDEAGSKAEEADGFIRANKVRGPVAAFDAYRAGLVKKDAQCLAVRQIVEEMGYRIAKNSAHHTVTCVQALLTEYGRDKDLMLRMFRLCVSLSAGEPIIDRLFKGLCHLERYLERKGFGSLCEKPFMEKLQKAGAKGIDAAMTQRALEVQRGGDTVSADGVVHKILNKGLRTIKVPGLLLEGK